GILQILLDTERFLGGDRSLPYLDHAIYGGIPLLRRHTPIGRGAQFMAGPALVLPERAELLIGFGGGKPDRTRDTPSIDYQQVCAFEAGAAYLQVYRAARLSSDGEKGVDARYLLRFCGSAERR